MPNSLKKNASMVDPEFCSRRDFAQRSLHAILAVSLLDHLCSADLLASSAKPTATKWLNRVNQIGLDLRGKELSPVQWQSEIDHMLSSEIDLKDLTQLIDFDKILKKPRFVSGKEFMYQRTKLGLLVGHFIRIIDFTNTLEVEWVLQDLIALASELFETG